MSDMKLINIKNIDKKVSLWERWRYKIQTNHSYRTISNIYYDFIRGIKNFIKWKEIIWRDRNWDGVYIFKILRFKIKNTRDCIQKNKFITDEDLNRIKKYTTLAIKLIDCIIDETYKLEYLNYFESEINWNPTGKTEYNEFTNKHEEIFMLDIKEISSTPDIYFKKYPRIYKLIKKQIQEKGTDEKYTASLMARENQQRAKSLLFKILDREIGFWWD